jgi:hypothetical protein
VLPLQELQPVQVVQPEQLLQPVQAVHWVQAFGEVLGLAGAGKTEIISSRTLKGVGTGTGKSPPDKGIRTLRAGLLHFTVRAARVGGPDDLRRRRADHHGAPVLSCRAGPGPGKSV